MTRVAALDCGTNSVRLLVADVGSGTVHDVRREVRIVRLGQGVDRDRRLRPEALERLRAALREYAVLVDHLEVRRTRLVATSAVRDAANRDDFAAVVRAELGIDPDVVTGEQEAALALAGVRSGLGTTDDLLVVDLGGGSTELVRDTGGRVRAHSMDVGSVRLTERHLRHAPPDAAAVARAEADVRAAVERARADVDLGAPARVVGVAATVLTVVALALHLERYDAAAVDGATVTAAQVRAVGEQLLGLTREQIAELPVVAPGREDVIAAGALVLHTVLDELGAATVTASERDILDGVALGLG